MGLKEWLLSVDVMTDQKETYNIMYSKMKGERLQKLTVSRSVNGNHGNNFCKLTTEFFLKNLYKTDTTEIWYWETHIFMRQNIKY